MQIPELHQLFLASAGIVIDTRKIIKNNMFFAIKGEKFDANTFAKEALERGCAFVVIDNSTYFIDNRTILVNDSLETLQQLATFHRNYLNIPIIALTGSNGKTTTKELIYVVLQKKYRTAATVGNLNNHIGVPLTLLSFTKDIEIGIVEMGANHQKEIEFLCDLALPDYGYITNFGKAHLEGFGGVEGVIAGKTEMYVHLRENHKIAFVNGDDLLQIQKSEDIERVLFGVNAAYSFVNIQSISANPFVEISFNKIDIQSKLIGLYNANNINIAITIGKYFGIADLDIKRAVESYIPENNRSQMIVKNSNEIILDAYNANPSSMKVAIENFLQLEKTNKILFLGDMFELGNESTREHQIIVEWLCDFTDIKVYFIGHEFYNVQKQCANSKFFNDFEALKLLLLSSNLEYQSILIKGSRGMALERILEYI